MPLGLAFVAGGLATINPCGFSLLPALVSFYIAADDERSRGSTVLEALRVGASVAVGVMGIFLLVGVPVTLGASQIVRAVPWAGVVTGATLLIAGFATLSGRHLSLALRAPSAHPAAEPGRRMFVFGVAYGIASLGCTLPIFLSVIGASLATSGSAAALLVIGSYALGMFTVVMAISLAAALAREGLVSRIRKLVPRMHRIGGLFLTFAGIYLTYYWGRVLWGSAATLARDPVVGSVQRIAATLERVAVGSGSWVVGIAAGAVLVAVLVTVTRRKATRSTVEETTYH